MKNLNEHLAEVIESFDKLLKRKVPIHLNDPPYAQAMDVSIDDIKDFITQAVTKTSKLTYEAVRLEELPKNEIDKSINSIVLSVVVRTHNSCLSQLDANWEKFRGEEGNK